LDKYQPLVAQLLEYYESDSSVEVNVDTDTKVSCDPEQAQRRAVP
jgi:hypothetical protein